MRSKYWSRDEQTIQLKNIQVDGLGMDVSDFVDKVLKQTKTNIDIDNID